MSEVTGLSVNHKRLAFTFNGNRHELSLGDVRKLRWSHYRYEVHAQALYS
jgi:hypothetical protein